MNARGASKFFGSRNSKNVKESPLSHSVEPTGPLEQVPLTRKPSNLSVISSSTATSLYWSSSHQYHLENIPDDVLREIANWCNPATNLRVSLACKRLAILFRPYLYNSVDLAYTDLCRAGLKVFSQRPTLTRYIKILILKPNRNSGWTKSLDKSIDEVWIIDVLQNIASQGDLPLLTTFKWYGKELPKDSFWLTLRTHCPDLRNIGTSVGQRTLQAFKSDDHLFAFRNLTGFHLFTQVLERWTMFNYQMDRDLPETLWEMLFHSQALEELTLDGTCFSDANAWNLKPVFSGRWPGLRRLALGNVFYDDSTDNDDSVCKFLQEHPNLEQISSMGNMSYSPTAMGCLLSLPKLQTYRGRLQQLKDGGKLTQIRNMILTDWFSPSANFGDILGNLHHLESLTVCVNFVDDVHSQLGFYDRLLEKCSQLKYLEISSTSWLSLRELSSGLRLVPDLRTLTVTRVHKMNSNNLTKSALHIASQNLNLREFTIRDVPVWDHLDQLSGIFRTKHLGHYTVQHEHGERILSVQEVGVGALRQHYRRSFSRLVKDTQHL
ncbi:MAG: hypothetical protein NXY57DRAFT_1017805 [Lentinula lateritia]|uniref:F-box domain-containing protein n=1 Tax=Lentinula lateritia TaxID=40482 RepID=A0ABQ8VAW7_9AGAR|nr:MAG: hypothetical protein NXY57DRAFT_1017805 [Lentinula lateritia]KAJ4478563.1 hypothetical protein C8R41DRAFT_512326 [Lentinula lateritia]